MDLKLTGKSALVTGSSSGMGAEMARVLAAEGAAVVVHGRNRERAEQVAAGIRRSGATATAVIGDLSDGDQASAVANAALEAVGGRIDILVNNAGGGAQFRLWSETTPDNWIATFQSNVVSTVRMIHHLLPHMMEGHWGRIIQIASTSATQPNPTMPDYQAAKAALVNISVCLSKTLAGSGITVNTVTPGTILTPGVERHFRQAATARGWAGEWDDIEKRVIRELYPNPSGRIGRVEDVATLVAFVASPLAGFINGANLRVDGGRIASIN